MLGVERSGPALVHLVYYYQSNTNITLSWQVGSIEVLQRSVRQFEPSDLS